MDCRFRCVVDGAIGLPALERPFTLVVGFARFVPSFCDPPEGLRFEGIPWYPELLEDGVGELLPREDAGPT